MMTPPFCISAIPRFTLSVPTCLFSIEIPPLIRVLLASISCIDYIKSVSFLLFKVVSLNKGLHFIYPEPVEV